MDMNKLMEMAQQMKSRLETAQNDAANQEFKGEAGGGMVAVTITGRHEVVAVKIEQSALADKGLLEDLVRAAVNQAIANAADAMKNKMGNLAAAMGFDPSLLSGM